MYKVIRKGDFFNRCDDRFEYVVKTINARPCYMYINLYICFCKIIAGDFLKM